MTKLIGHSDFSLDQCMTNDAHMHFIDEGTAMRAEEALRACRLDDGTALFFVESTGRNQIFAQLSIEKEIAAGTQIILPAQESVGFFELFETICERTGAHIQEGDVFARGIDIPKRIYNHEISDYVLNFFQSCHSPNESAYGFDADELTPA